jgi:hypothetical protein
VDAELLLRAGAGPAVFLAIVAAVLLAGCGGEQGTSPAPETDEAATGDDMADEMPAVAGDEPEPAGLVGVWVLEGAHRLLLLAQDGRFAVDDRGVLDTDPAAGGTWALDGRTLRFANGAESAICSDGAEWSLRAGRLEDGAIETVFAAGDDPQCPVGVGTRWQWIRISPQSPSGLEVGGETPDDEGVIPDAATLRGVWLLEGTSTVLRLGDDGTYVLDDDGRLLEPADSGTFAADAGVVSLTSGPDSRRCSPGDRLVWNVRLLTGPSREDEAGLARRGDWVLRGEVEEDSCGHPVPRDGRWLLLSP